MPSFNTLSILFLVAIVSATAFILQDLPLERFERSDHGSDEILTASQFERRARAGMIFRPISNIMRRYRMMSG